MTGVSNALRRYGDNYAVERRVIRSQAAAVADSNDGLIAQRDWVNQA